MSIEHRPMLFCGKFYDWSRNKKGQLVAKKMTKKRMKELNIDDDLSLLPKRRITR